MNCGYGRLLRSLASLQKKSLFLISGNDPFLKRDAFLRLLGLWRGTDADFEDKDASGLPWDLIEELVFEDSLVSDLRVLSFTNIDKIKGFQEKFRHIVSSARGENGKKLIFTLSSEKHRLDKEIEALFDVNVVCEPISSESKEFGQFIEFVVAPFGKKLHPEAVVYLGSAFSDKFSMLASELIKVCNYVGEKEEIEVGDVDACCTSLPVSEVFILIDSLFSRDKEISYTLIRDLIAKEASLQLVVFLMTQRLNSLQGILEARRRGENLKDYMMRSKIPLFQYEFFANLLRTVSFPSLRHGFQVLAQCELDMRNRTFPEDIILMKLVNSFVS